ncbi:MAG: hypothetical protein RLZZ628_3707 [Bacteroidota bacterium]
MNAYLTGALSNLEKEQFESILASDEALFFEVESQRALRREGLRQQVEQVFKARQSQKEKQKQWMRRIGVALLLTGLFSGVYQYFNSKKAVPPTQKAAKPTDSIEYAAPKPLGNGGN